MNSAFRHPTALVETEDVGDDTSVWAYSHVLKGARIGRNCSIGDHCFVEGGVVIGDNVTVKNGTMLFDGVTVEEGAFLGPRVTFTNDRYPRSRHMRQNSEKYSDASWMLSTLVGRGASIGACAVILPGVTIGRFAMVGAGSVVVRDVPSQALVAGTPARAVGWVCECGVPLAFEGAASVCGECGRKFALDGGRVEPTAPERVRP
jgi:UDP-2-acetamido-3-amino-2,3-dideoxy-glucuronate N-acetyltransferase